MTRQAVEDICAEYGIRISPAHRYPSAGETRAVSALERIYAKGDDHFRLVLTTAVETTNNRGALEASFLWAISDLLIECKPLIDHDASRWLEVFDKAPVDRMVWMLRGHKHKRTMLKGMLLERIRAAYENEPELFERAA